MNENNRHKQQQYGLLSVELQLRAEKGKKRSLGGMGDDKVDVRQLRSPLSKEVLRRQRVRHVGATNDHNILLKLPLIDLVSSTQLDRRQKHVEREEYLSSEQSAVGWIKSMIPNGERLRNLPRAAGPTPTRTVRDSISGIVNNTPQESKLQQQGQIGCMRMHRRRGMEDHRKLFAKI